MARSTSTSPPPPSPAARPPPSPPPSAAFPSHPSDLELIECYLRPWVDSSHKAGAFVHVADVYAADPADLTREYAPAVARDGERAWYFLTPLRRKSVRGRRKARTVATGEGCWHNEAKSKPVFSGLGERRQVGRRQSFSFVKKDGGARARTGWLMMELQLLDEGQEGGDSAGSLVLCKVYRSPRNPEPSDDDAAASGRKTESNDESSSAATAAASRPKAGSYNKSSDASRSAPSRDGKTTDDESIVAPSRRPRKAGEEISGAPGREEEAPDNEGSAETSSATPSRKRKATDNDSSTSAAAPPARKMKTDGATGSGAPAAGLLCPHCGTHITAAEAAAAAAKSNAETKSEAEAAKGEPAPDAAQGDDTCDPPEKEPPFKFL
ncbi:hypothetical protein ACP4OV_024789 [Aristida adscensionis]